MAPGHAASRWATYVAVIGPGAGATDKETETARLVGSLLADRGVIVVCGGLDGVMAAACEGAIASGGLTVGLLPGQDRISGNNYLSVVLPTGLGELRNGLVVRACDAVIAVGGSWGTLSEVALAMHAGKPTIVIGGWTVDDPEYQRAEGLRTADSAAQAVEAALRQVVVSPGQGGTQ